LEDMSRSRAQALIRDGNVKVNGKTSRPGYRLKTGDRVTAFIPPCRPMLLEPQKVPFEIVFEDNSFIVVNKPAGLVVHPAPGHRDGTLVHGLLSHCKDLSGIGGTSRPGIVHRLDKDTSGLIVVAKNDAVHHSLSTQFKSGNVKKQYMVLLHGPITPKNGVIDLPIARHHKKRREMAVVFSGGKRALTTWRTVKDYPSGLTLAGVSLRTGRTHQIRVHFSYLGHPVVGDPVYGIGKRWWKNRGPLLLELSSLITRQMLHAMRLGFIHPAYGQPVEFEAALPKDMITVIDCLERLRAETTSE
jgi:23S rRNA pseudouridine1911/1915/1917 synthase